MILQIIIIIYSLQNQNIKKRMHQQKICIIFLIKKMKVKKLMSIAQVIKILHITQKEKIQKSILNLYQLQNQNQKN